jgi:hypothetical protein
MLDRMPDSIDLAGAGTGDWLRPGIKERRSDGGDGEIDGQEGRVKATGQKRSIESAFSFKFYALSGEDNPGTAWEGEEFEGAFFDK